MKPMATGRCAKRGAEIELAAVLESSAPFACKQFVCQKLWIIGTVASVPVLRDMLASADPHIAEAACYALSQHRSPAVGQAVAEGLRAAKGNGLIGIINLAGARRDPECADRLAELALSENAPTADAAIGALGKIASTSAVAALTRLHTGARSTVAADALLQAGQELAARGKRAEAHAIYERLASGSGSPAVHRGALMAMRGK